MIGESDISGTFSKEYMYNGSSRLALVDVGTGNVYYYGNDALGTPEILTNSNNVITWEAIYKPFGEAGVQSYSSVTNNFRFPGQYYDQETGLHYNYNRYYDPSVGRYLTPDPIGQAGGLNLFAYVGNDPVNNFDPMGLAQFGYRGLDAIGGFIPPYGTGAYDDEHNTEWVHEQLYFDDVAKNPNLRTNIGFFGDNGFWNKPGTVRPDKDNHNRKEYTFRCQIYDDEIMRKALANVESRWNGSSYNIAFRNCQDFNDALRKEYFRLGGKVTCPESCACQQ
jgi:RHS repeat-associated protein